MFAKPARALAVAMLAALVAGCGGGSAPEAGPDPTVEPSAGAPSVEGTGHEQPPPKARPKPAVDIAGGPAGESENTLNDDGSVCVYVRWLGGDDEANLGAGIAFEVTEVRLSRARPADVSCPGERCAGYTFDSNSDICVHAVRPGKRKGTLSLYGRIRCSAPAQECAEFRSRLRLRTIPVPAARQAEEPTEPEPSEPEPSDSGEQPTPTQ